MGAFELMIVIHKQPFQMLKQTFPCHERCEQLRIMHLLHITPTIKLVESLNSMLPNMFKYRWGPLVVPYIFSMFHNNGGVTNLREKSIFESKKNLAYDDESGVGGLNRTPHLMKPLVLVSLSLEFCVTFVMNLKQNFFDWEFWSKNPFLWFLCPHVQLDQSAILDKSIWT